MDDLTPFEKEFNDDEVIQLLINLSTMTHKLVGFTVTLAEILTWDNTTAKIDSDDIQKICVTVTGLCDIVERIWESNR